MADQNTSDVLNALVARVYRCLLQYAAECWPWTASSELSDVKSTEQRAVEEMVARQQQFVGRLVDAVMARGGTVDFGSFPDNSELHYVSLDYLLGKFIADEEKLVADVESARSAIKNDSEAAGLVSELLAAEKENLARLRNLAAKAPAAALA